MIKNGKVVKAAHRRGSVREEVGEAEIALQGSYGGFHGYRGLLGSLVSSKRDAPLSPDAFATVLSKKEFTNGADSGTVINLIATRRQPCSAARRSSATNRLKWSDAQFERLGEALCFAARSRRWR